MIVGERKPLEEILALLGDASRVLVAGCGTCVAVCMTGGEQEVAILAEQLRLTTRLRGHELTVTEVTAVRQCDREFLEPLRGPVQAAEVVLSLACGIGTQWLAETYPERRVVPGVNTTFLGVVQDVGEWAEFCQACGNCLLAETGGVCPIARCAKSLMNGPCGGSAHGLCEVHADVPCAWQLIIDRLQAQGRQDELTRIRPPRNWQTSRDGGPRRLRRRDQQA